MYIDDDDSDSYLLNNNHEGEDKDPMYDETLLLESLTDLSPPIMRAEEFILSKFKVHVDQFSNMRNYV